MPKEEWGVKRLCPNCSTRFYDLHNDPMTCPSCGQTFSADSFAIGKGRTLVADKSDPKSRPDKKDAADDDDDDVIDDTEDDDDDVDLGDDVLEEDDDDSVSLDDIADVASDDDDS